MEGVIISTQLHQIEKHCIEKLKKIEKLYRYIYLNKNICYWLSLYCYIIKFQQWTTYGPVDTEVLKTM